ncbi:hypothetical protein BH18VER1_BH18VER1_07370 [soil metagenome]
MDPEWLKAEFALRAPWIFQFRIGEADYGGHVSAVGDVRIRYFQEFAPEAAGILELGALEGAHTFMLAEHSQVQRVVALEGRAANLRKALFLKSIFGAQKAEFLQANLETDPLSYGDFDAVFCSGLLYHLPEPWKLIERIAAVAPKLFLWTMYSDDASADLLVEGFRGRRQVEGGVDEPLSGLSDYSIWLTLGSLIEALTRSGYERIEIFQNDLAHPAGPAVTLGAAKGKS